MSLLKLDSEISGGIIALTVTLSLLSSPVQNALSPIELIVDDITTFSSLLQPSNALLDILLTPSFIITSFKRVQFLNAPTPITVTVEGIITDENMSLFSRSSREKYVE